ncbi:hypothetical protein AVEN_218609-1 [Araneus ventricosus]|uniref:Uncharacterized protein n=1 Tax=Araneus ventricosus TaxID=182803 RepID=A0A4Y2SJL8_ARAVE|nr:hypothetical protein AVEN_218609-1 [Araneus ventricosus]
MPPRPAEEQMVPGEHDITPKSKICVRGPEKRGTLRLLRGWWVQCNTIYAQESMNVGNVGLEKKEIISSGNPS